MFRDVPVRLVVKTSRHLAVYQIRGAGSPDLNLNTVIWQVTFPRSASECAPLKPALFVELTPAAALILLLSSPLALISHWATSHQPTPYWTSLNHEICRNNLSNTVNVWQEGLGHPPLCSNRAQIRCSNISPRASLMWDKTRCRLLSAIFSFTVHFQGGLNNRQGI